MIEALALSPPAAGLALRLKPNRSITARDLRRFFALLAATSVAVACYSASQGNVFAPGFALLELTALALCLRLVWLGLDRQELIEVTPAAVRVARRPGPPGAVASFDPWWVRVERRPGETPRDRLVLTSHGRSIEIGAFLGDEERGTLERQLREALRRGREAAVGDGQTGQSG